MSFRSGRSTDAWHRSRRRAGVDVYLLPAVIGGGLGDIEEVLAAGRRLARAGFRIRLYRRSAHPLPRAVDGPWDWPPHRRVRRLHPAARAALTITPAWGVSAAPRRPGPLGHPGPWAEEIADIERAYGADWVLHISLEEFARTLGARAETRERLREGGVRARAIPPRLALAQRRGEVDVYRAAYERFRAFDRPNVLALFATFERSRSFAREFPQAVQTGPLWPNRYRPVRFRIPRNRVAGRQWVWYASPASAERIAPEVLRGLATLRPRVHLWVRSSRPWTSVPADPHLTRADRPVGPTAWRRRFARADLRIVTGSRTLLEALEIGGPFLYFNGVLGSGSSARRHRPEKIDALERFGRRRGVPGSLLRDLARFARGEDIEGVVRRIARRPTGWDRLSRLALRSAFAPPFDDAGSLIVAVARTLERRRGDAPGVVRWARQRANS